MGERERRVRAWGGAALVVLASHAPWDAAAQARPDEPPSEEERTLPEQPEPPLPQGWRLRSSVTWRVPETRAPARALPIQMR
jgi:hypothetical protein